MCGSSKLWFEELGDWRISEEIVFKCSGERTIRVYAKFQYMWMLHYTGMIAKKFRETWKKSAGHIQIGSTGIFTLVSKSLYHTGEKIMT